MLILTGTISYTVLLQKMSQENNIPPRKTSSHLQHLFLGSSQNQSFVNTSYTFITSLVNHTKLEVYDKKTIPRHHWVRASPVGRLGNQLFIIASSYGIAKARNARWCMDLSENDRVNWNTILRWNERPEACPLEAPNVDSFQNINEDSKFGTYLEKFFYEYPNQSVFVGTYLQSYRYWTEHNIKIPFELTRKEEGIQWVKAHNVKVGIHIRRTDYLHNPAFEKFTPPNLYYEIGIQYILNKTNHAIPKSSFWVTSDDMEWVKTQAIFEGMHLSEFEEPDKIMSTLSACKHLILGVGSFSWWSAYLLSNDDSDRILLYHYYDNFYFMPGDFTIKDYYPWWWVGLELTHDQQVFIIHHHNNKNKIKITT